MLDRILKPIFAALLLIILASCAPIPTPARAIRSTETAPIPTTAPTLHIRSTDALKSIHATLAVQFCEVTGTGGEALNVRKTPNMEAEIIFGLLPGERVEVLIWGADWHKITRGNFSGYVKSEFCEVK